MNNIDVFLKELQELCGQYGITLRAGMIKYGIDAKAFIIVHDRHDQQDISLISKKEIMLA